MVNKLVLTVYFYRFNDICAPFFSNISLFFMMLFFFMLQRNIIFYISSLININCSSKYKTCNGFLFRKRPNDRI